MGRGGRQIHAKYISKFYGDNPHGKKGMVGKIILKWIPGT
jgi:hypothetical protein